jgi:hypothetical protein
MEDDELAAFRRAPDEWHRLKEEQQGQLMRDCRWLDPPACGAQESILCTCNRSLPCICMAM